MSPESEKSNQLSTFFWIIVICCSIIVLWVIPGFVPLLQKGGVGAGLWGFFTIIALGITVLAPLLYGWHTKDTTGAVIIGFLPFLLVMGISRIVSGNMLSDNDYLLYAVLYCTLLSFLGGAEGYFASKGNRTSLAIGILLAGIWIGIFFSGIS